MDSEWKDIERQASSPDFDCTKLPVPIQLKLIEFVMIKEILKRSHSVAEAAKLAGIQRTAMVMKLKKFGIRKEDYLMKNLAEQLNQGDE